LAAQLGEIGMREAITATTAADVIPDGSALLIVDEPPVKMKLAQIVRLRFAGTPLLGLSL
jgi:hypothetical protein